MRLLKHRKARPLLTLFILTLVVLVSVACGAPSVAVDNRQPPNEKASSRPLTITDDAGRALTFDEVPARVITIAPSTTELLFSIGVGGRIVATDENSDYPEEAAKLPRIGGLYEVDMEKVAQLSPDLVIVVNDVELVRSLENAGFTVFIEDPQTLDQILHTIREFGQIFNVEEKASQVAGAIQARMDAITAKVAGIPEDQKVKVFYEVWNDPLMTAGPGSFISDVIRLAGGINIGDAASEPWPEFSLETLVDENPDVIVTPFKDTYDSLMNGKTDSWKGIKAVREKRVFLIDQDLISRPSVRLVQALEQLARLFYPDRFK